MLAAAVQQPHHADRARPWVVVWWEHPAGAGPRFAERVAALQLIGGRQFAMSRQTKKVRLPLPAVYRHLEPGPVVLLTTARAGQPNVMPMSWHTMIEFIPPLIGCVVSNRNYSFQALRRTKECVINIPTATCIRQVVACGNVSGRTVDKFARFGLTPHPAREVQAPLILECPINIECHVIDTSLVNRYCFFILEAVAAWRTPRGRLRMIHHQGMGHFMLAGPSLVLPSRAK